MRFTAFLLKNLLRRKVRSLLTTLAIALAVGTQVTLLGISDNFEESLTKLFAKRGVGLVVVDRNQPMQLGSSLDEKMADKIADIPGVQAVDYGLSELISMHKGPADGGTEINTIIQGWRPDSFMMNEFRFLSGRKFEESEKGVCLLGNRQAAHSR